MAPPVSDPSRAVLRFARLLRDAGLPVGPDRVVEGQRALAEVGLERRDDVYWALHASFVSRAEEREIYDQAFEPAQMHFRKDCKHVAEAKQKTVMCLTGWTYFSGQCYKLSAAKKNFAEKKKDFKTIWVREFLHWNDIDQDILQKE